MQIPVQIDVRSFSKLVFTSNFANYKYVPNPIAISRTIPSWFLGDTIEELAPPWKLVEAIKNDLISKIEYTEQYFKYLSKKNINKILQSIPNRSTLLCWESSTEFCHRHLISWIISKSEPNTYINEIKRAKKSKILFSFPAKSIPIIDFEIIDKKIKNNMKQYGMSIYKNIIIIWNNLYDKRIGTLIKQLDQSIRKNIVLITLNDNSEIIIYWSGNEIETPFELKEIIMNNDVLKISHHRNINSNWEIDDNFNLERLFHSIDDAFDNKFQSFLV